MLYQDFGSISESQYSSVAVGDSQLVYPINPGALSAILDPPPTSTDIEAVNNTRKILQEQKPSETHGAEARPGCLGIYLECTSARNFCARYESKFLGNIDDDSMDADAYLIRGISPASLCDSSDEKLKSLDKDMLLVSVTYKIEVQTMAKNPENDLWSFTPTNLATLKMCLEGMQGDKIEMKVILLNPKNELFPKKKTSNGESQRDEQTTDSMNSKPKNGPEIRSLSLQIPVEVFENYIKQRAPKPGLKQEFDLTDASDKVITLLSRLTLSNKWSSCSSNVYGTENRPLFLN